ncbi:hypothetical protein OBBRIDRAFT_795589 [Obba rivulosa]|uniref:Uncharacterized protein n=1 Tax=Obba rivulosa TaxID=1052685 RepID=A0A8E2DIL6_9APHY|nr:hypothetical protein OBBRIDRAFT_795589 [Obba rivulosa]
MWTCPYHIPKRKERSGAQRTHWWTMLHNDLSRSDGLTVEYPPVPQIPHAVWYSTVRVGVGHAGAESTLEPQELLEPRTNVSRDEADRKHEPTAGACNPCRAGKRKCE